MVKRASSSAIGGKSADALQALAVATQKCGEAFQEIQQEHNELLEKCGTLQKECDDLRNLALQAETVSDPYVMVLIDTHSHKFGSDVMGAHMNDGARAAKLLKAAVLHYLSSILPRLSTYRVVVRVYMRPEEIARVPLFTEGFSREELFFDVVTGVSEDVVEAKIAETLRVEVRKSQCQHILVGARNNAIFDSILRTCPHSNDKITFLKGEQINNQIVQTNLNYQQFSHIFHSATADGHAHQTASSAAVRKSFTETCKYHLHKGGCTRLSCRYRHPTKSYTSPQDKTDPTGTLHTLHQLPDCPHPHMILVNTKNERLDTYIHPPTKAQWAKREARSKVQRLCSTFYLQGECSNLSHCKYDHRPIDADILHCIRYVLRGTQCSLQSNCRRWTCTAGHICQKPACANGKTKGCTMSHKLHKIDREPAKWVLPTDDTTLTGAAMSPKYTEEVLDRPMEIVAPAPTKFAQLGELNLDMDSSESGGNHLGYRGSRSSTPSRRATPLGVKAPRNNLVSDDLSDTVPEVQAPGGWENVDDFKRDTNISLIDL